MYIDVQSRERSFMRHRRNDIRVLVGRNTAGDDNA